MSDAMIQRTPSAVVGAEVTLTREKLRELNGTGLEQARLHIFNTIGTEVMKRHETDIEVCALDSQLLSSGRKYRLELLVFTRREWLEHVKQWDAMEARIAELEAKLCTEYPETVTHTPGLDPHKGANEETH